MFRGYSQQVSPSFTRYPISYHLPLEEPGPSLAFICLFLVSGLGLAPGAFYFVCFVCLLWFQLQTRNFLQRRNCNERCFCCDSSWLEGSIFIRRSLHVLSVSRPLKRRYSRELLQNICIHFFPFPYTAGQKVEG